MTARVVVADGMPPGAPADLAAGDALRVSCDTERANLRRDLTDLEEKAGRPTAGVADLLDLTTAIYGADIALQRGRNEGFVRDMDLDVAVRSAGLWRGLSGDLARLVHYLTGDNITFRLYERAEEKVAEGTEGREASGEGSGDGRGGDSRGAGGGGTGDEPDAVCLVSGGLDSLAGAVMLLRTGRRPLFVTHRSGNATVDATQRRVMKSLARLGGDRVRHAYVTLMPRPARGSFRFPRPEDREPSRRSRSLLFMALGAAAATATGGKEVYLCDNGVLTAALPLTPSRTGALSTKSTHPAVFSLFNHLCERAGFPLQVLNPFLYQTKAELIRDVLRPVLRPEEILGTVSCWMAGRRHRQCGGCLPCLLRRISLLAGGLPDEAYELDVLADPEDARGTDAYVNLVDLLSYVALLRTRTEVELLLEVPALLDLHAYGVSVPDVVSMLKRFAGEATEVVERFPASARLLSEMTAQALG